MQVTIPRSFNLFGLTYEVRQPNKITVDKESVLGHCDSDNGIIQLRKNLKKQLKEITYLHEITHAILYSLEYDKLSQNEDFVERFSKALHQVLTTSK